MLVKHREGGDDLAMAPPPKPRGPLGLLIERYKDQHPDEPGWEAIWIAAGVRKPTLEHWISGRTGEPPLRGMLRLRRFLRIPFEEFEAAALAEESEVVRLATEAAVDRALRAAQRAERTSSRSRRQSG